MKLAAPREPRPLLDNPHVLPGAVLVALRCGRTWRCPALYRMPKKQAGGTVGSLRLALKRRLPRERDDFYRKPIELGIRGFLILLGRATQTPPGLTVTASAYPSE